MSSRTVDVLVSVVALLVVGVVWAATVLLGVFSLAFLDYCPPASCSAGGALTTVVLTVLLVAAVWVAAQVRAVRRIVRGARSWPGSLGAIGLSVVALVAGAAVYALVVWGWDGASDTPETIVVPHSW